MLNAGRVLESQGFTGPLTTPPAMPAMLFSKLDPLGLFAGLCLGKACCMLLPGC